MKQHRVLLAALLGLVSCASAQTTADKPYRPTQNLTEVSNLKTFEEAYPLTAEQKAKLRESMFVVRPTEAVQLFHIYENNSYREVPQFVTTDAVLQLYHVFYGFTLRHIEAERLLPIARRLTAGNLHRSIAAHRALQNSKDEMLAAAARKNVIYFGVADRLLGLRDELPAEVLPEVRRELQLTSAHEGFQVGAIFPYKIDYSQFVPRGHYTRSPALTQYFRGMMWFGLVPLAVTYLDNPTVEATSQPVTRLAREQVLQSLLLVRGLFGAGLDKDWERIYEPTTFFVGAADDLTPREWKSVADRVYGLNPAVEEYSAPAKFEAFIQAIETARTAKIQAKFGRAQGVPAGTPNMIEPPVALEPQLRFMGQRYIPDSEILQRLSEPMARPFPSGLDIMAVLGSARAQQILDNPEYSELYNAQSWDGYGNERAKLISQFAAVPASTWNSNLYWGWLDVLRTLFTIPKNAPWFMQNSQWQEKSLTTALASWAELRHDTILYAKQSVVEMGDGAPELVKGYVEPNVAFYNRLLSLTQQSRQGLTERDLMSDKLKTRFENFEDLLKFLRAASEKELRGQPLSDEGYARIQYIGGELEMLTMSVMEGEGTSWEILSDADKNMAVVADVHTVAAQVLEAGVGRAAEIIVMVPIEGKWTLTRGAVFQYHEFKHPAADRLTDEKWQRMLTAGTAPAPPPWTKSYSVAEVRKDEDE